MDSPHGEGFVASATIFRVEKIINEQQTNSTMILRYAMTLGYGIH